MSGPLFARKTLGSIEASRSGERLPRVLGAGALTGLGIGGIIGTGIFIMAGMGAHDIAGPALIVSFLIAAVACIAVSLCFAELASSAPVAGSAYTYAYITLGEGAAWLVGWNLVLQYGLAAASVAQGWSHYFQDLALSAGLRAPVVFAGAPQHMGAAGSSVLDLPAVIIVLIMTAVAARGIRVGAAFNYVMLALKLGIILFVIVVGAWYVHPSNWAPFAPFGWGANMPPAGSHAMPSGVLAGAAIMFYAYMGFESITNYTEEARRPRRDLPLAILGSVLICTALYAAMTAVLTGMVPYSRIDVNAPVSAAFGQVGLPWARVLVSLGATIGITSVLFIILMSLPRILFAIGRDGLLPQRFFGTLHPRFETPVNSTIVAGAVVAVLAAFAPLRALTDLVIVSTLGGYVVVAVAVLVLRRRGGGPADAFRAPLGPLVPLFAMASCLLLVSSVSRTAWLQIGACLVVGAGVYLCYGRAHSVLASGPAVGQTNLRP